MARKITRRTLAIVLAGGSWLIVAKPLTAHHAFAAEFDSRRPIKLAGKVSKVEWLNPHMWLYLDVKGPDGRIVNWAIEGAAPNAMFRRGVRKDSLPVGVDVVVEGFQAKNGKNVANGRKVTWPDGLSLFMGSSGTGAPDDPNGSPR